MGWEHLAIECRNIADSLRKGGDEPIAGKIGNEYFSIDALLTRLGNEGWELVGSTPSMKVYSSLSAYYLLFKRPAASTPV